MQISENTKLGALLGGVGMVVVAAGIVSFTDSKNAAYRKQKDALRPVTENASSAAKASADAADNPTKAQAA